MKKYSYLRERLMRLDIRYSDVARHIGKSDAYITNRMTGRYPWDMSDVYLIMDLINEPVEYIADVFPRDGINELSYEEIRVRRASGGANVLPPNMCVMLVPMEQAESGIMGGGLRLVR